MRCFVNKKNTINNQKFYCEESKTNGCAVDGSALSAIPENSMQDYAEYRSMPPINDVYLRHFL